MARLVLSLFATIALATTARAADVPVVGDVEGQPLAANAARVLTALDTFREHATKRGTVLAPRVGLLASMKHDMCWK